MDHPIMARIQMQSSGLSPAEARVADWITDYRRDAAGMTLAEVATAADVSEPTVIRFCRTLGLNGFRELRSHLLAATHTPESYLHQHVSRDDSTRTALAKVLGSSIRTLIDLARTTDDMPFEEAVPPLAQARQIIFVGLGASGYVARDACHKFFRLGIPCSTALDMPTVLQSAAIAEPGYVYIVISQTGHWPELVKAMQTAGNNRAAVFAITGRHTPLGRAARLVFDCHAAEDTSAFTPMSSRLAHLALLDALQVSLALHLGEAAERRLRLAKRALSGSAVGAEKRIPGAEQKST